MDDGGDVDRSAQPPHAQPERVRPRVFVAARCLVRQFQGRRERSFRMPALPESALDALSVSQRPDALPLDMIRVLERDPQLAAAVLRVANSPLYGVGRSVDNLRAAVMRLGMDNLRDVVQQAVAESHIFRGKEAGALRALAQHSVQVAHMARAMVRLSPRTPRPGPWIESGLASGAFLAGLLHDLGRAALLGVFAVDDHGLTPRERAEVMDVAHADVGAAVAREWKLPQVIIDAIERHHAPWPEQGPTIWHAGHLVALAEAWVGHLSQDPPAAEGSEADEPAIPAPWPALGLPPEGAEALVTLRDAISERCG